MRLVFIIVILFFCLLVFAEDKPRAEYNFGKEVTINEFMKVCQEKYTFNYCFEEFKKFLLEKSAQSGQIETGSYIGDE